MHKHCEEAVNGRLTTAEKVLEHPCAFKAGLNVVAVVLFVYLSVHKLTEVLVCGQDNSSVYLKKIPQFATLPPIEGLYWQNQPVLASWMHAENSSSPL